MPSNRILVFVFQVENLLVLLFKFERVWLVQLSWNLGILTSLNSELLVQSSEMRLRREEMLSERDGEETSPYPIEALGFPQLIPLSSRLKLNSELRIQAPSLTCLNSEFRIAGSEMQFRLKLNSEL